MRVYVAGPITGHHDLNEPLFREAAEHLRLAGYEPVVPHDLTTPDMAHDTAMRTVLPALMTCDAILLLPSWHRSVGARLEASIAGVCGMQVMSLGDLEVGQ